MSLKPLIDASSDAIAADPANGRFRFTVDGELTGPTEVALRARGHEITVDEPPVLGGSDRGANPVEHALIALASCQAISYRFWAAKLDIELEGVDVVTEGDLDLRGFLGLDDGVRAGFTGVRIKVTPVGPESPERYQELADAVDAHCPVLDLFSHETPIDRSLAVPA
jgi:putative redox protein